MSGAEPAVAAAVAPELIGAGTAAAGAAGTAAATGAAAGAGAGAATGAGAALGGTALGSTSSLGTGLLAGSSGVGLTAPAGGLLASGSAAPGMAGAMGTGITGAAGTGASAASPFATAAVPSSFSTPFTVGDALAKAGQGMEYAGKANSAMQMAGTNPQRPQMQRMPGPFEGQQPAQISPQGMDDHENRYARMLLEMKMMQRMG